MVCYPAFSEGFLNLLYLYYFREFFSRSMLRFSRIFQYVLRSLFLIFILIYGSILIIVFLGSSFCLS